MVEKIDEEILQDYRHRIDKISVIENDPYSLVICIEAVTRIIDELKLYSVAQFERNIQLKIMLSECEMLSTEIITKSYQLSYNMLNKKES